jgi:hypothetical protein
MSNEQEHVMKDAKLSNLRRIMRTLMGSSNDDMYAFPAGKDRKLFHIPATRSLYLPSFFNVVTYNNSISNSNRFVCLKHCHQEHQQVLE